MTTIPEWLLPAHCSANSLTFYSGDKFPGARGDVFVAQRGSWNATAVLLDAGDAIERTAESLPYVSGFGA